MPVAVKILGKVIIASEGARLISSYDRNRQDLAEEEGTSNIYLYQ